MKLRKIATFIVAVLVSALLSPNSIHAETTTLIKPPTITLTKIGGSFLATPAVWSAKAASSATWLINGKAQSGLKGLKIASPAKKGTVVQYTEKLNGISAFSNQITIGNVAVNGFIEIGYSADDKTKLVVNIPKTTPSSAGVSYQWFSGPFEVRGAKAKDYAVSTGDQGSDVSLVVKFSAKGLNPSNITSNSVSIPVVARDYKLLWSDEFQSQSALNSSIWKPENGDGTEYRNRGWGNQERQYYLANQISFNSQDGLNINASTKGAENYKCYYGTACEWVSSKYVSKGLVGFKYGRIEARIKGPVGNGSWAAFWLLGANIDERPWPGCGEIDVVELLGRDPNTVYGTPHGPASGQSYTTESQNGLSNEFHNYAVDWLPDQITWYLDGKPYGSLNRSSLVDPEHTWVFDHEYYLLMNLAMGGTFGGAIDANLHDSKMSIQWIHFSSINGIGEVIQH